MIEVTFKFPSFEAAKEFFDRGAVRVEARPSAVVTEPKAPEPAAKSQRPSVDDVAPPSESTPSTNAPAPEAVPAKPKRGRPRKDKAVDMVDAAPTAEPAFEYTAPAPSLDDVRVALKSLNAAKGIELCRQVFAEFKVPRPNVNDLKAESYGAFVKRCNELAA